MKKLILFLLVLTLASCSKESQKTHTSIKFSQSAIGVATMLGGVLVFGREVNTLKHFSFGLNNENDSTDLFLPHGQWDIKAVAWSGGPNTQKLTGDFRCASTVAGGILLDKVEQVISLTLNDANCAGPIFGAAYTKETDGGSGLDNQIKKLKAFNCIQPGNLNEEISSLSHCSSFGGQGTAFSFKISFKNLDPKGGLHPSNVLESICQDGNSTGTFPFVAGYNNSPLRIPMFHPEVVAPFQVKVFSQDACAGVAKVFHFDQGITNDVAGSAQFRNDGNAIGNTLNLFYGVCENFDPAAPYATGTFQDGNDNFICNSAHLLSMETNIEAGPGALAATTFHLMQDIDFFDAVLPQIGTSGNSFKQNFEGHNNKLKNFSIVAGCSPSIPDGFFKYASGGSIRNLEVDNFSITGGTTGSDCDEIGFVGFLNFGDAGTFKMENVKLEIDASGRAHVGGAIGKVYGTSCSAACSLKLKDVIVEGDMSGLTHIGGIVGEISQSGGTLSSEIVNSAFMGTITGRNIIGGIAGSLDETLVINAKASNTTQSSSASFIELTDTVVGSYSSIGGLVGSVDEGVEIIKSFAIGKITSLAVNSNDAWDSVGGLLGNNIITDPVKISNSWSDVNIDVDGDMHGGLVGELLETTSEIKNCHAHGDITELNVGQAEDVGGLVGYHEGIIDSSYYSSGSIFGANRVGGLVGHSYAHVTTLAIFGKIIDSYISHATVSGSANVGGLVGKNGGDVTRSISHANVSAVGTGALFNIGGLIGKHYYSGGAGHVGLIEDVISTGSISDDGTGSAATQINGGIGLKFGLSLVTASRAFFTDSSYSTSDGVVQSTSITCGIMNCSSFDLSAPASPIMNLSKGVNHFGTLGVLPNPILLNNEANYAAIGDNPILMGKHFKMNATVTFISNFLPIGSSTNPFVGYFEADSNYKLIDLTISEVGNGLVGMFRVVGQNASGIPGKIGDDSDQLILEDSVVSGKFSTGTVVGHLAVGGLSATVINGSVIKVGTSSSGAHGGLVGILGQTAPFVTVAQVRKSDYSGTITSSDALVGGAVGFVQEGDIYDINLDVDVHGYSEVGGLTGKMNNGNIFEVEIKPFVSGVSDISADGGLVGGLIGNVVSDSGSFNYSQISSFIDVEAGTTPGSSIGGLLGYFSGNNITLNDSLVKNIDIYQADTGETVGGIVGGYNTGILIVKNTFIRNSTIEGHGAAKAYSFGPSSGPTYVNCHTDDITTTGSAITATGGGVTAQSNYAALITGMFSGYSPYNGSSFASVWDGSAGTLVLQSQ
ncbi:MAG: hypothetical protein ACI9QD_000154 [Thermoproteota archaeon]|jgi:hypothetical protein